MASLAPGMRLNAAAMLRLAKLVNINKGHRTRHHARRHGQRKQPAGRRTHAGVASHGHAAPAALPEQLPSSDGTEDACIATGAAHALAGAPSLPSSSSSSPSSSCVDMYMEVLLPSSPASATHSDDKRPACSPMQPAPVIVHPWLPEADADLEDDMGTGYAGTPMACEYSIAWPVLPDVDPDLDGWDMCEDMEDVTCALARLQLDDGMTALVEQLVHALPALRLD